MFSQKQEAFASKLKQLRIASHLSQTKLSKELNISRSCLANYESGKRFPSADILDIIANYFKVSVDFLLATHSSILTSRGENYEICGLLKEMSANGTLDITGISPLSKIALFEFYNFLKYQEENSQNIKGA